MNDLNASLLVISVFFLSSCNRSEPTPPADQTKISPPPAINLQAVLRSQLKSAADMAREGKLESAIHQIEISQRVFPNAVELQNLHKSLVRKRDQVIQSQTIRARPAAPPRVLNRNQMRAPDRLKFSMIFDDWNTLAAGRAEHMNSVLPEFKTRLLSILTAYPDLVEARLLQARIALATGDGTWGREAGAKIRRWKLASFMTDKYYQSLFMALNEEHWMEEPSEP
jgi:hypothetical protein